MRGKEGWSDPAPPVRIFGDTYDVGTCGIIIVLVAGVGGAIVTDSGPVEAAPIVAANIERLGIRLDDVKIISPRMSMATTPAASLTYAAALVPGS